MLHSKTPEPVKDTILESFTKNDSLVRVLFATIAFGMGVNAKGVKTIIHVGPSKNLEAYVQESGRCGRGGEQSRADNTSVFRLLLAELHISRQQQINFTDTSINIQFIFTVVSGFGEFVVGSLLKEGFLSFFTGVLV